MRLSDALKISALSGLLLVIFSLPTLTATQLVGVLGTSSNHVSLIFRAVSDSSTFTTSSSNNFNVSFQLPKNHIFATVTNPSDQTKSFTIQILNPKSIPLGAKLNFGSKQVPNLSTVTTSSSSYSGIEDSSPVDNSKKVVESPNDSRKGLATQVREGYNSSADLTIAPHQSVPLAIDTTSSDPDHGTLILSFSED